MYIIQLIIVAIQLTMQVMTLVTQGQAAAAAAQQAFDLNQAKLKAIFDLAWENLRVSGKLERIGIMAAWDKADADDVPPTGS